MFFCKNNSALSLTLRAHIVVGSLAVVQRLIHDDVPTCHLREDDTIRNFTVDAYKGRIKLDRPKPGSIAFSHRDMQSA